MPTCWAANCGKARIENYHGLFCMLPGSSTGCWERMRSLSHYVKVSARNLLGTALAGAVAVMLILAVMLIPWLFWQVDYAPNLATNFIIEHTPPDNAVSLQTTLGPLAMPSAIL